MKQQASQRFVLKIHSTRLRKAKWKLTLPLREAQKNDEVISLGDSQMLRWIDELNGLTDSDEVAKRIKNDIKKIKKEPNSIQNRRKIKEFYDKLNQIQYKPDYMCLIIDKEADYHRACKGYEINGIKYTRLVGTNGGVKTKTIVFVSERLAPELRRRINNGRNESVPLTPAKLEAYRALTCSGSIPVSLPKGIAVVPDCETTFFENVIRLDDTNEGEPVMEYLERAKVDLDESDGYGIMLPSLADRWSEELGLDYRISGANTRFSWEKGMVFCFDFIEFADTVAHKRIIKDAWGHDVDLSNVELILTTSMLKLWKCYDGIDQYLARCEENKYTFGIAKVCPKELESERDLNYQFIQSYELDDEQIDRLISPTINYIRDVLTGDYSKALLFLKGEYLNDDNVKRLENDFVKALMIDERLYEDPFVKRKIYQMIRKRINDAKIGVIKIHGNYSIVSGDPYSLCQSIFGLPVTGLLKSGEIYNKYWIDRETEEAVCFRAPMTCHNNIRRVRFGSSEETRHWYRDMTTCTIFNSWDTSAHALNGMDKDGDLVMITDNSVLVGQHRPTPALMCVQRKAGTKIVTEEDLIQSNIDGFGDDIGKITNRITTMFDVKAQFQPDTEEYKVLEYRIKAGQLFQQNAIDKAKGIIAKPMPKEWYDRAANKFVDEDSPRDIDRKEFNMTILADKKPYFMRYIYPNLMKQYKTYVTNTNKKCLRNFRIGIEELLAKDECELTDREKEFIYYYNKRMPVGTNDCVMNKICRRVESEFDGFLASEPAVKPFDYGFMKSGAGYSKTSYNTVAKLYEQYTKRIQEFILNSKKERIDEAELAWRKSWILAEFKTECEKACSNARQLCDITLDLCYNKNTSKQFTWDICCNEIIENLLERNNWTIKYPVKDSYGNIEFNGNRFRIEEGSVDF